MGLILWIIFGALVGWIASIIVGTNEEQGAVGNILVGIAGAFLGGFVVSLFGGSGIEGFNLVSLVIAVFGSVILLTIYKGLSRSHR